MSLIFINSLEKPIEFTYVTGSKEIFGAILRPPVWQSNKVAIQGETIYLPTIPNGCGYLCIQGGITGTEPIWDTAKGAVNLSGTTKFKTIIDNFKLLNGETVSLVSSTFNNMTGDNVSLTQTGLSFRVLTATTGACLHIVADISTLSGLVERQVLIFTFNIITPTC